MQHHPQPRLIEEDGGARASAVDGERRPAARLPAEPATPACASGVS
jgi:hypothetical protein